MQTLREAVKVLEQVGNAEEILQRIAADGVVVEEVHFGFRSQECAVARWLAQQVGGSVVVTWDSASDGREHHYLPSNVSQAVQLFDKRHP